MKKVFAYSIAAVLTIVSCHTEKEPVIQENSEVTIPQEAKLFMALIEDEFCAEAKTSMDASGNVLWKQGDQVSIFAGSTINEQYQVTDSSDGKTAAALNRVSNPGFVAGTDIDNNVAFYPYTSTAAIAKNQSGYLISDVTLPATQTYTEGSFGNGAFPMTAVTSSAEDMNLKFKNVLGGLKLQLKGTATIASISITGNNSEILCGDAEVTVSGNSAPTISLTDAAAKTVTLDCGVGISLDADAATPFIIALPPMTMTCGFTVVVTDTENKQMEIKTTKSQTINRSSLLKMPAVNYEGIASSSVPIPEAVDLGLSVKWASFNLGASSSEGYGDYYAWGETETKSDYSYSTNKFVISGDLPGEGQVSKYNTDSSRGIVDNKTVLDPEDDVARVKLGGNWRIPRYEKWEELMTACEWIWTTQNGINGYKVTANNGNSIFLPAAGERQGTYLYSAGSEGDYWSSSSASPGRARIIYFYSGDVRGGFPMNWGYGISIRPVYDDSTYHVTGVTLSLSSLLLINGESHQLKAEVTPSWASDNAIIWSSSNTSVATVSDSGLVTAVGSGATTITVETHDGGFTASCDVTVITLAQEGAANLGLSVDWAACNLCETGFVSSPYVYGNHYAWGETETKSDFSSSSYKFGDIASTHQVSKYNTNSSYGPVDNKKILDPEDDVASVKLGGNWRIPTDAEWTELRDNCTWIWTTQNGVTGMLVFAANCNGIFLPAAGEWYGTKLNKAGSYGYYWSSSLVLHIDARAVNFYSGGVSRFYYPRYDGLSVRPVTY